MGAVSPRARQTRLRACCGGLSTLRGAPPQHTLGATICFGEERQVWTDLGWKFEPGRAPKATIWASKMAPKSTIWGSPGAPGGGPGHQNPPQKGVPEGSGRALGSRSLLGGFPGPVLHDLGPLLGGVLGPMLSHFGDIFVALFWNVLDITSGPLLGAILSPTWTPIGDQNPPGNALETKPDAKQRKC